MAKELKGVVATHVSLVKNGANGKKFFLTKSEDNKQNFEMEARFLFNKDDEQKLVYGVVYEPDTVDLQKDFMTAKTIEKMAHDFLKEFRNIDKNHDYVSSVGTPVESYITMSDMEYGGEVIKKGSWVLVTEATDDAWESIKKGDLQAYSIGGYANEVVEHTEKSVLQKIFSLIKSSGNQIEVEKTFKQEMTDAINNDIFFVMSIFRDAIFNDWWNMDLNNQEMKEKLLTSIQELYEHVKNMTFEIINKETASEDAMNEELKAKFAELEKSISDNKEELKATKEELELAKSTVKDLSENLAETIDIIEKSNEIMNKIEKQTLSKSTGNPVSFFIPTKSE